MHHSRRDDDSIKRKRFRSPTRQTGNDDYPKSRKEKERSRSPEGDRKDKKCIISYMLRTCIDQGTDESGTSLRRERLEKRKSSACATRKMHDRSPSSAFTAQQTTLSMTPTSVSNSDGIRRMRKRGNKA